MVSHKATVESSQKVHLRVLFTILVRKLNFCEDLRCCIKQNLPALLNYVYWGMKLFSWKILFLSLMIGGGCNSGLISTASLMHQSKRDESQEAYKTKPFRKNIFCILT